MADRCETCDAYAAINKGATGVCRAAPPIAIGLGMEQVLVLGKKGMRPIIGTYFPEVSKDLWCRAFNPIPIAKPAFDPSKLTPVGKASTAIGIPASSPQSIDDLPH